MSIAVNFLDGLAEHLQTQFFGTVEVERQIVPDVVKTTTTIPKIIVALQGLESMNVSRTVEEMKYTAGIGVSYPTTGVADYDLALGLNEEVQMWLSARANHSFTTIDGKFNYFPPFIMESVVDPEMIRSASIFFAHTNFTYSYTQLRR
jgi:hypothetical protein